MIGIINYEMGNIRSVEKKLNNLKIPNKIINNSQEIKSVDKIILPGVGHFSTGVQKLKELELWDNIKTEVLVNKKPILGICLGMQLLSEYSEEGEAYGLGFIKGKVIKFRFDDYTYYKIPHTGWNTLNFLKDDNLINGITNKEEFYFVHSYYFLNENSDNVICTSHYGIDFASIIQQENIYGVQFHPEKSQSGGNTLLRNFYIYS